MNRPSISVLVVGVCLLLAVEVYGQTQKTTGVRPADAAATISSSVEPNSPDTTSNAVAVGPLANGASPGTIVPRLMKYGGVLHDATGKPLSGTVDVTFSLYTTEAGGEPLWFETQSVQADDLGRYTALLGAMHTDGLPIDLFTSGEAHWMGIQVGLEAEQQPRVLLVSVPYALKAGDAETLGGKPASAFMLASAAEAASTANAGTISALVGAPGANALAAQKGKPTPEAITSGGTTNYLAGWLNSTTLGTSAIYQDPTTNNIGIGTTSPYASLQIGDGFGGFTGFKLVTWDSNTQEGVAIGYSGAANSIQGRSGAGGAYNSNLVLNPYGGNIGIGTIMTSPQAPLQIGDGFGSYVGFKLVTWDSSAQEGIAMGYYLAANSIQGRCGSDGGFNCNLTLNPYGGNVGIGTASPAAALEVNGAAQFDGAVTFAAGQTVTGNVSTAAQLVSTVATGTAPLSVASNTVVPNLNASLLGGVPATGYAKLATPNTFVSNQTINVSAGDGLHIINNSLGDGLRINNNNNGRGIAAVSNAPPNTVATAFLENNNGGGILKANDGNHDILYADTNGVKIFRTFDTTTNDTVNATVLNELVGINQSTGNAQLAGPGFSGLGAIGIAIANAGTAPTNPEVTVAFSGGAQCVFDNTAINYDFVEVSPTTAGNCHDVGPNYPPVGQVLGVVVDSTGTPPWVNLTGLGTGVHTGVIATNANCSSSASPAVCTSAGAGSVVIAASTSTLTVDTTAVTANSQIMLQEDSSLGATLGVTCNTTVSRTYAVSARTAGTNFTITSSSAPSTNPACLSYVIVN